MSHHQTFTQAVYDYLTARPHIYVEAIRLESIGGRQAWRTRVSEARQLLEARNEGTIKNRQRRMKADGKVWTLSEYAFIPAEPVTVRVEDNGQQVFI